MQFVLHVQGLFISTNSECKECPSPCLAQGPCLYLEQRVADISRRFTSFVVLCFVPGRVRKLARLLPRSQLVRVTLGRLTLYFVPLYLNFGFSLPFELCCIA